MKYKMVKVFSATKREDRAVLGEEVTAWMQDNPDLVPVDTVVVQSSDREFHCLTIVVFFA